MYEWPLINDNISEDDKDKLVEFIRTPGVRFTQHENGPLGSVQIIQLT